MLRDGTRRWLPTLDKVSPNPSGQPGTHLTSGAHPHVVPRHPRLDPLADRYAARTHGMKTSEIRALFSVVSRPEVVSLAGGMPAVTALPLDAVGQGVQPRVPRDDVGMRTVRQVRPRLTGTGGRAGRN